MRATQVYFTSFDAAFFKLTPAVQTRIQAKIDEIGRRLGGFQHHQLKGSNRHRVRVGDYRVIYTFDVEKNEVYLLAVGHRREIYKGL